MDVRQLTCFLAVVDHGGFTRAAEHLFIAQPSLSQTIKGLEGELGVPLFHRVGRRVVLSEAGAELMGPARVAVRDLDVVRSMAADLKSLRVGKLELIAMPSPALEPLTTLITDFMALHPSVRFGVEAAFTPEGVVEAVRGGVAEIGLLGTPQPFRSAAVDVVAMERQDLVLVLSPAGAQHESFRDRDTVDLRSLHGQRMIATQRGSLMRRVLDDALAEGVDVQIVVEAAHRTSILPLVMAGVGHAVLPSSWRAIAEDLGLRVVGLQPANPLHVAVISRLGDLTPGAREFLRLATAHARASDGLGPAADDRPVGDQTADDAAEDTTPGTSR